MGNCFACKQPLKDGQPHRVSDCAEALHRALDAANLQVRELAAKLKVSEKDLDASYENQLALSKKTEDANRQKGVLFNRIVEARNMISRGLNPGEMPMEFVQRLDQYLQGGTVTVAEKRECDCANGYRVIGGASVRCECFKRECDCANGYRVIGGASVRCECFKRNDAPLPICPAQVGCFGQCGKLMPCEDHPVMDDSLCDCGAGNANDVGHLRECKGWRRKS